jgi:hypothetical protein
MKVFEAALMMIIISYIPVSAIDASLIDYGHVIRGERGFVFLETGRTVNVSTTVVEASVFTPNVTTIEVQASVTSVEAVYSQRQDWTQIAPIIVVLVLIGLTVFSIVRKHRGSASSTKALS